MRTDELIRALSADRIVPAPPGAALALALAIGAAVGAIGFALALGVRTDALAALKTVRFPFKFVLTLALAAAGVRLALALARPGADWAAAARWLVLPAALLGAAVVIELAVTPASAWLPRLMGSNAAVCLTAIPLLSAAPLAAVLLALRSAAPTAPARAGATAGLLAGAVAATLYAAHCTDDSPLFVAAWYALAIAVVVAVGALLGPRVLRW